MDTNASPVGQGWLLIGRTSKSTYYLAEPTVLACVPDNRCTDDEASARENASFQENYWVSEGRTGCCLVFFDFLADQTAEARAVYRTFPFVKQVGVALVGGTPLSRAIASFFMGLSRPKTPTRFFGTAADAFAWCRSVTEQAA
jgi:hypothetical protein